MHDRLDKETLSLVVTDSGLGGLSICADLVRNLSRRHSCRRLSVVYFNAWPLQDKGYNYLGDDGERIRVFGNAIEAMNRYGPDLILIACNTLSVVYLQGGLSAVASAPVVDIIDSGVGMIARRMGRYPASTALILGTQTTVASKAHRRRLTGLGIPGDRIIQQHCHGLAGAIERDPQSDEVNTLLNRYMAAAVASLPAKASHIQAALCCTHYGYIQERIQADLARRSGRRVDIVNPNQAMGDVVVAGPGNDHFATMDLKIQVVSRVGLPPSKINAIAALIEGVSPPTAQALRDYREIPDLFDV